MQGNLDEFLFARVGAGEDDDDAGPDIDVGSRAAVKMRQGGAASVAAASVGAASLRVRFCTTGRTLFDEFLSARVGAEEDNVQFVISDSEGDSLIESMISESEGDVQGNNNSNNNDNLPPPMQVPEGAPPAAPNINDGP